MGHHYIPRRYLRHFEVASERGFIWMFDKKLRRITKAAISSVAQERGFYEDREERELANRVEMPANDVIDKLLSESGITRDDRRHLAVYIATMIKRVPAHRIKARRLLPTALDEVQQIVTRRDLRPRHDGVFSN